MIQLKLTNKQNLFREIDKKISGIKELTQPIIMERITSSVYSISKREFVRDLNRVARSNPERFHHIYEWDRVGDNRARLYDVVKASRSPYSIIVKSVFIPSRAAVPLDPLVRTAGPTGKSVKTRHVFKDKARMMESGRPAGFVAKKNIVFADNGELVFRSKGQRIAHRMPNATRGQFEEFMRTWYATKLAGVIERSRVFKDVERTTAAALNTTGAGAENVRAAVISTLKKYEAMIDNV